MEEYILCVAENCRVVFLERVISPNPMYGLVGLITIFFVVLALMYLLKRKKKAVNLLAKKLKLSPAEINIVEGL